MTRELDLELVYAVDFGIECDCDLIELGRAAPTQVLHFDNERDTIEAFLQIGATYHCGRDTDFSSTGETCCRWHAGARYVSIHGPRGHVLNVRTR